MPFQEPLRTDFDLNFKVGPIPVRVHPFFWVIALFLSGGNTDTFLIWIGVLFISILVHELGHVVMFGRYGIPSHVVLYAFGGLAVPESSRRLTHGQHIAVSFAGPAAGFILAATVLLSIRMSGGDTGFAGQFPFYEFNLREGASIHIRRFFSAMLYINIFWGLLNLLPIYPLDGGQISRELFVMNQGHKGVERSLWLSLITASVIAIVGYAALRSLFMLILFGWMAWDNWMALQRYGVGRGNGRGRWH